MDAVTDALDTAFDVKGFGWANCSSRRGAADASDDAANHRITASGDRHEGIRL